MSSSMHEVFHWGPNTSGPKKLSLSVAGSQIDFEGPPSTSKQSAAARYSARNRHSMVMVDNSQGEEPRRSCLLLMFCWQKVTLPSSVVLLLLKCIFLLCIICSYAFSLMLFALSYYFFSY